MSLQAPRHVLMVRPSSFGANPETMQSNVFQHTQELAAEEIQARALQEFDSMVLLLHANGIETLIIEDTISPSKPDAIFPNNWLSMQPDGDLVIYAMMAANRRVERRGDVLEIIKEKFMVKRVLDFSDFENKGEFVEGTGSLIFDHVNRTVYAARSPRTHESLVKEICQSLGYSPVLFNATDASGQPIYHTNVMMAVTTDFALVSLDTIRDDSDRDRVIKSLNNTGHKIISISFDQLKNFAGNVLEVLKKNGERILVISETAVQSLVPGQLDAITRFVDILPIPIPTIEKYSGGSVRCMLAGVHLPLKG